MTTPYIPPHRPAASAPRVPAQQAPPQTHGTSPTGHHENLLKSVLRKAGILVGTAARVTILGRDGVDL